MDDRLGHAETPIGNANELPPKMFVPQSVSFAILVLAVYAPFLPGAVPELVLHETAAVYWRSNFIGYPGAPVAIFLSLPFWWVQVDATTGKVFFTLCTLLFPLVGTSIAGRNLGAAIILSTLLAIYSTMVSVPFYILAGFRGPG